MDDAINIIFVLGFIALMIFGILKSKNNKRLYISSFILTIIFAIVPQTGYGVDTYFNYQHFGFPAEIIIYRGGWGFSFNILSLLLNFFLFYWLLKLTLKLWKVLTPTKVT